MIPGIDIATRERKSYDVVLEDVIVKDREIMGKVCVDNLDLTDAAVVINHLRRFSRILDKIPKLRCLGLAANQIGFDVRIFVMKNKRGKYEAFVNPSIVKSSGGFMSDETCYSAPGCGRKVKRYNTVTVTDQSGKVQTFKGIMAACFQHELDHLDGKILGEKA